MHTSFRVTGVLFGMQSSVILGLCFRGRSRMLAVNGVVSRVRENRMHGLTGGSWKRNRDRVRTTELLKGTRGNPVGPALRNLPSILVTAPALDPTR